YRRAAGAVGSSSRSRTYMSSESREISRASSARGLFAVALVTALTWVTVERRVREPLVDMAMLTQRGTVGATVASTLLGFAFFTC
ncbi:hypothetical protein JYK22_40525, partial [Nonomuraea sp. RK-328]|nr:hypothetical protein [Nonomuraea sp. RK-328]